MKTNYSEAWLKFRKSEHYKNLMGTLASAGIKFRYRNNILRFAFDAGWKATNTKIMEIKESDY